MAEIALQRHYPFVGYPQFQLSKFIRTQGFLGLSVGFDQSAKLIGFRASTEQSSSIIAVIIFGGALCYQGVGLV